MKNYKKNTSLLINTTLMSTLLFTALPLISTKEEIPLSIISTFTSAQEHFDKADEHSLFVFDIDQTLFNPKDPFLQTAKLLITTKAILAKDPQSSDENIQILLKNFPQRQALIGLSQQFPHNKGLKKLLTLYPEDNSNELEKIYTLSKNFQKILSQNPGLRAAITNAQEFFLLDPNIVNLLKKIEQKGAPSIALSSFKPGDLGYGLNEQHRFADLEKFDIIFSHDNHPSFSIPDFRNNMINTPSVIFHRGIISSSGISKGIVLKAFIDSMKIKPSKVIFFDDLLRNHRNVFNELKNDDISVYRYLFTAANNLPQKKIDASVVKEQVDYIGTQTDYAAKLFATLPPYTKENKAAVVRSYMEQHKPFITHEDAQKRVIDREKEALPETEETAISPDSVEME